MKINWSSDSTIIAGAGVNIIFYFIRAINFFFQGSGSVLFGYVIEKQLTWENWEIQLTEDNRIHVVDIINEMNEELDFKDRYCFVF